MLTELISKLSGREASERTAMEDRYVELLLCNSAAESVVNELRIIMGRLHKSAADAATDAQVLTRAQSLQATVRAGSGLTEQRAAAVKARKESAVESRRIVNEREEMDLKLAKELSRLEEVFGQAGYAEQALGQLAQANPALLRTLEIIKRAD